MAIVTRQALSSRFPQLTGLPRQPGHAAARQVQVIEPNPMCATQSSLHPPLVQGRAGECPPPIKAIRHW